MGPWHNTIFLGDCLNAAKALVESQSEKIRLIYLDPPFFSNTDYTLKHETGGEGSRAPDIQETATYSDRWQGGLAEYLSYLRIRLAVMSPLLRDDGSIWLHLDWHVSHYAKALMDELFGYSCFVNEIVWKRTNSPKPQSRGFGSQHDTILVYAKDQSKFRVRPVYVKHDERSLRPYMYDDDKGRFRLIEIEAQGIQRSQRRKQFEWRGRTAPYLYRLETLDEWWDQGLIYKSKNDRYSKKQYLDDVPGVPVSDLWLDIAPVQGASDEYTGFLTQKPEALLSRIIECASDPDDIVADFFAGAGTTAAAAEKTKRRWIACDSSEVAVQVMENRMSKLTASETGKAECAFTIVRV